MLAILLERGAAMLAGGDISAARKLYARAAEGGSGLAAAEVGKTYDPTYLADRHLHRTDPASWGLDSNCPVPWTMRLGCRRNQSEHKEYISRYGDDMPDIKGWTRGLETLAQRTGSTEADNV
jgi:hypothetical protein